MRLSSFLSIHLMRRFTRFALLLCLACILGMAGTMVVQAADKGYFSAFPELPVPPQMTENTDSAVRFDQPDGRIITLHASGTANPEEIVDFYEKSLPSLGWTRHSVEDSAAEQESKADKGVKRAYYTRDQEVLFIEINQLNKNSTRLDILLRPH